MIEKIIENFNLDEKEAKIYLASLSLGRAKVSEIGKEAKLNRITAYEILKRLRQKGLANSTTYNEITYFQVISPEKILEKMERQVNLGKELLPQLLLVKDKNKSRAKVEYYELKEGAKIIYEDTLNCQGKVIYNFANPKNLIDFIGYDFLNSYMKRRLRKKINVKVLIPKTKKNLQYTKEIKTMLREVKFFDDELYSIPNEIMIYDNKIAMLSFSSKIGVIIEDPDISLSLKSIWKLIWDNTK